MASAIVVFSHLRWDSVNQRPRALLTRLARHYPVLFIEEPLHDAHHAFTNTYSPVANVLVCQLYTPVRARDFHDDQLPHLQTLLRACARDYADPIAWFCTPLALPLLTQLQPRLVVYDRCYVRNTGDDAPRRLLDRERALLKVADLVFTADRGWHAAVGARHPNAHYFPDSVDPEQFAPALQRANSHPAHRSIRGPRLGFYGVIDARIDLDLIRALADAHPHWQIVLVGPLMGIDPASLPQRLNLHYLGPRPYAELPRFLAGWDLCLLPFVPDCIGWSSPPAGLLEYIAAELPVVSTPLPDLAEPYVQVVRIAQGAPAFITACEQALLASAAEVTDLVAQMNAVQAATSWDVTVERMRVLLEGTACNWACRPQPVLGNAPYLSVATSVIKAG